MPNEIDPQQVQTANADQQTVPATVPASQEGVTGEPSTPATEPSAQAGNADNSGSAPAAEPKVVKLEEHIQLRHRAQTAEEKAAALEAENLSIKQQLDEINKPQQKSFEKEPDISDYQDVAQWERDKDLYKEQQIRNRISQENIQQKYNERYAEAVKKLPDLPQVISRLPQMHPAVVGAVQESNIGPEIAYYLAKNQNESRRIRQLSPWSAVREIGKIEAKIMQEPAPKPVRTISQAPEPIAALNSSNTTVGDGNLSSEERIAKIRAEKYGKR